MNLSFLNSIQIPKAPLPKSNVGIRGKIANNPEEADIRVFSDGRIYPSIGLVTEFNLEYTRKDNPVIPNGFDIFLASNWGQYPKDQPNLVLISPVGRDKNKIDIFGNCRYDKKGEPLASVIGQGSDTFGLKLIEMLKEAYGADNVLNSDGYVDLKVEREYGITTPDGIYNIPKEVTKGDSAGNLAPVRRENTTVFPLVIVGTTTEQVIEAPSEEVVVERAR